MESTAVALPLEENPEFLKVSPYRVYNNLKHLNKHKARGPNGLPNCLLKEYRNPSAASKWYSEFFIHGTKVTFCVEAGGCNSYSKGQASLRP